MAKACDIEKEYYLSFLIDPKVSRVVLIASAQGGMDIEKLVQDHPDRIIKKIIDPAIGLRAYQIRHLAEQLTLPLDMTHAFIEMVLNLYRLFTELDCSIVES